MIGCSAGVGGDVEAFCDVRAFAGRRAISNILSLSLSLSPPPAMKRGSGDRFAGERDEDA